VGGGGSLAVGVVGLVGVAVGIWRWADGETGVEVGGGPIAGGDHQLAFAMSQLGEFEGR